MGLLMTIFSIMGDIHSHSHLSHMYVCVLQLLRDMAHKMLWPNNIPLLFKKIIPLLPDKATVTYSSKDSGTLPPISSESESHSVMSDSLGPNGL